MSQTQGVLCNKNLFDLIQKKNITISRTIRRFGGNLFEVVKQLVPNAVCECDNDSFFKHDQMYELSEN